MELRWLLLASLLLASVVFSQDTERRPARRRMRLRSRLRRPNLGAADGANLAQPAGAASTPRQTVLRRRDPSRTNRVRLSRPKAAKTKIVSDTSVANPSSSGYKVVCYYTNWSQYRKSIGKYLPEHIDPFLCTHIIYSFGWMKKGKMSSLEENDESKGAKIGFYAQITNLKKVNPKLKVLLAIGGWSFGTKKFKDMSATRYSRQTFIFSAIPFLRDRNFDGLDIDWEYPKGSVDKENFVLLLQELREAFISEAEETGQSRLLLTAAVPVGPDNVRGGYDVPKVSSLLDFINLMAYDFHGKWENTVGHNAPVHAPSSDSEWRKQLSVDKACKMWVRLGAPKEKLVIGMPTYGRSFTLANPQATIVNSPSSGGGEAGKYTGEAGFMAYYEVCQHLRSGGEYVWDEEMEVPYMVKDKLWVGFDDERAIRNKMNYIIDNGYGGAMIWSIDMDDFTGTVCGGGVKYPLIGIMREMLLGISRGVGAKDVNWASVTKSSIAQRTTMAPPISVDPNAIISEHKARSALSITPVTLPPTPQETPKRICYYTSWSVKRPGAGRFEPEHMDPFICTHIIYAFATLYEHRLAPADAAVDVGNELKPGMYIRLMKLKEKNPNLKIILAVGGWAFGSKPFRELVSSPYRMNGFVYDSIEYLRAHNFDGLDIDWEYPRGNDDKANLVNLLRELRVAFEGEAKSSGNSRLLLTAAVPASFEALAAGYDVPEISKYLDYLNVMTYDFHGQWENQVGHNAPLFPLEVASSYQKKLTLDFSVQEWIKQGAPPQKILVGMPMYGRSFKLQDSSKFDIGSPATGGGEAGRYTQEPGFLSYYEVCDVLLEPNTTLIWDNEQQVPFAYKDSQWVGFDDERSLGVKVSWLKSLKLGGVMVWSCDMDDFRGNCGTGKFPLLKTIDNELKDYSVELTYDGPYENTGTLNGQNANKDPKDIVCQEAEGHISYHRDESDCTRYYMCEGERKHHMPCPNQLVFNYDQTVCDWPENVEGCETAIAATGRR